MYILILLLVALGIVAAIIALCSRHGDDTIVEKATCSTCNGENQKCEQECMMEAATKPIEYYDDEELDTFIGHLEQYRAALKNGDAAAMERLLDEGRRIKGETEEK